KSNSTYRYFPPLIPSQSQCKFSDSDNNEDDGGEYNEEENRWHALLQTEKKTAKCVPDVDKNLFSMEIHRKPYIIPTFRKPTKIDRPSTSFHAILVQDNNTEKQTT
ncbi:14491_t:CDS:2, partial [Gigaspora margarita]